jgi:hypothetical protein
MDEKQTETQKNELLETAIEYRCGQKLGLSDNDFFMGKLLGCSLEQVCLCKQWPKIAANITRELNILFNPGSEIRTKDYTPEERKKIDKILFRGRSKFPLLPAPQTEPAILLFGNIAFQKGKSIILYAEEKVGKSLFSIEVANNTEIKKPLFILKDDGAGGQVPIYRKILGEKVEILTVRELDAETSRREDQIKKYANCQIFWELSLKKGDFELYHKTENIINRVYKNYRIEQGNSQAIDKMTAIFGLVDDAIKRGVDFICLDSLNAIFGDVQSINADQIRKLTKMVAPYGITLLVIHHTNKKNESAGRKEILQVFDEVDYLRLEKR